MVNTINVSDEVWRELNIRRTPEEKTFNQVIKKLIENDDLNKKEVDKHVAYNCSNVVASVTVGRMRW